MIWSYKEAMIQAFVRCCICKPGHAPMKSGSQHHTVPDTVPIDDAALQMIQ